MKKPKKCLAYRRLGRGHLLCKGEKRRGKCGHNQISKFTVHCCSGAQQKDVVRNVTNLPAWREFTVFTVIVLLTYFLLRISHRQSAAAQVL